MCDQVNEVDAVHETDKVDDVHQVDPVHQVHGNDEVRVIKQVGNQCRTSRFWANVGPVSVALHGFGHMLDQSASHFTVLGTCCVALHGFGHMLDQSVSHFTVLGVKKQLDVTAVY